MGKVYDLKSEKICVEVFMNNKTTSKTKKDLAMEVVSYCPHLELGSVEMKMQNIAALCDAYNISYSVRVTPMKNWSKQNESVFKDFLGI